ncbi:MAG TPA: metallophosphoesterase [Solirubrobacterales bacterium]|jgi:UDP-2,3-diacylglucosamine pyrophosphatase LpxH|nr:metallophosphoesterase [Solirubrobacterales bacterium]
MRALVISDTHFGAWTGRDLLREEFFLERLAPRLEGIDELIFLGDLFDFLFGSVDEAVDSADGLLRLIAARMAGKRLVFLAGNHDHHLVHRDEEDRLEARLASGQAPAAGPSGPGFFKAFLERRLPGVEVEIAYPTYEFAGVLCSHGHYLDPHARLSGSRGDRLLTRTLWAIASGGPEEPTCIEDYESVTTLLTEWLYIAAQMPHGTHAQRNVFRAAQRAGRVASALALPARGAKRLAAELRDRGLGDGGEALPSERHFDAEVRGEAERQAREQPLAGPAWSRPIYPEPTVVSRSDPSEHALEAFAQVVENLGWNREAEQIVFAHTHQPLADVRSSRDPRSRYWNTGSWIYEPDLGSRQAYARYLRYAWPGTAVLIDSEAPEPRLLELLTDLNPLHGGPGLPPAR